MSDALLVAILAAGGSRRLGRPKQLEPVAGESLIHRQCRIALAANVGPVLVVLGCESTACTAAIVDLDVATTLNADWANGMSTSLHAAVRTAVARDAAALMIVLCDQHGITAADLQRVADAWRAEPTSIVAARHGEAPGPPAILPREQFDALLRLTGDAGARSVLASPQTRLVDLPLAHLDLDTEQDARALRHE